MLANAEDAADPDAAPVDAAVTAVAPTPSPTALVNVRLLIMSSPSWMPAVAPTLYRCPTPAHQSHDAQTP